MARKKIDFVTAGGRTTAYVPELQKLNGVQAVKVVSESKKHASKTKDSNDDVDNGIDEQESDGEETIGNVKSKKGGKPGGRGKKPSNKRKYKESDDDNDSDSDVDDTDEVPKTETQKAKKNKQAKTVKTLKEKVVRQESKPTKKKAK